MDGRNPCGAMLKPREAIVSWYFFTGESSFDFLNGPGFRNHPQYRLKVSASSGKPPEKDESEKMTRHQQATRWDMTKDKKSPVWLSQERTMARAGHAAASPQLSGCTLSQRIWRFGSLDWNAALWRAYLEKKWAPDVLHIGIGSRINFDRMLFRLNRRSSASWERTGARDVNSSSCKCQGHLNTSVALHKSLFRLDVVGQHGRSRSSAVQQGQLTFRFQNPGKGCLTICSNTARTTAAAKPSRICSTTEVPPSSPDRSFRHWRLWVPQLRRRVPQLRRRVPQRRRRVSQRRLWVPEQKALACSGVLRVKMGAIQKTNGFPAETNTPFIN